MAATDDLSNSQRFYHGTRLVQPGYRSNFGTRKDSSGRVYTVEQTGRIVADPNLTKDG